MSNFKKYCTKEKRSGFDPYLELQEIGAVRLLRSPFLSKEAASAKCGIKVAFIHT
jgi:hypothetical protein